MTNKVEEFHLAFGHIVRETPGLIETSMAELRYALLHEEWTELKSAILANDKVEIADALCDLQYVLSGAVVSFGLNDSYLRLRHLMNAIRSSSDAQYRVAMIWDGIALFKRAVAIQDLDELQAAVDKIQVDLLRMIAEFDMGSVFEDMFNEVHRSNMSKLCHTIDEAKATKEHYTSRGVNCDIFDQHPYFVVRIVGGDKDGKILKGLNYSKPDLVKILKTKIINL